jgi:hypothetical protein
MLWDKAGCRWGRGLEFEGGGGRGALSLLLLPLSLLCVLHASLYCDSVADCQAGADIFSDIFFSTCSADEVRYVTGYLCVVSWCVASCCGDEFEGTFVVDIACCCICLLRSTSLPHTPDLRHPTSTPPLSLVTNIRRLGVGVARAFQSVPRRQGPVEHCMLTQPLPAARMRDEKPFLAVKESVPD